MDNNISPKNGQNLFIVDLETVSFLNKKAVMETSSNNEKYYKMPFLYLISSYLRNQAMDWADENYNYIGKKKLGSWMIYKFSRI